MQHNHTLTRHRDIQNWVTAHDGRPAVSRIADRFGEMRSKLTIQFNRVRKPTENPGIDDGVSPISWNAWLAELDRQQLALRVDPATGFELVARKDLN